MSYHFADVGKMIDLPKGAKKEIDDIMLSRYACYLVVQNANLRKEVVALDQTYFVLQTRKQEVEEIGEDFLDLSEDRKILDHMGSIKLAANLFRVTQTEEKSRRDNVKGKDKANNIHYEVGKR